jgi:heptosyltransferase-2
MKRILVIQNKRIGDVLIASVLATNLKIIFPDSHITFLVYDYTSGVIENNPSIDQIVHMNDKELKKLRVLFRTIRKVRNEQYDIILDPYAKFQSRMMCLFSKAPVRIGFKRKHKKLKLPYYTQPVDFLDKSTLPCGKALEDRINMLRSVFELPDPIYRYKIHLRDDEKTYPDLSEKKRPVIILGVLGSTPNKSLPFDHIASVVDFIADNYNATLLFNYAPHQKEEAEKIYDLCRNKQQIDLSIYEDNIRGFIQLMNDADMLISNEGGSVHIAKALSKPTFTIYSPYIDKSHWNSFEDGIDNDSIHLFEEKPDLFKSFTREERQHIEKNPGELYRKLTPEMIINRLAPFMDNHFKRNSL